METNSLMFSPLRRFFSDRQPRKPHKSRKSRNNMESSTSSTTKVSPPQPKTIQAGVKVKPAPHHANPVRKGACVDVKTFIESTCREEFNKTKDGPIIQSSFEGDISQQSPASARRNGFVDTAVNAYNQHHHLIIRPEDIWFSILSQLNLYINANAEQLRHMFVAHEGKKQLKLEVGKDPMVPRKDTTFGIDWASFGYLM